nr:MAG TPA: hypothetical protein [Caudoviricetes sp.]
MAVSARNRYSRWEYRSPQRLHQFPSLFYHKNQVFASLRGHWKGNSV